MSSYVRLFFKYCGIIGLLVNIPITIILYITVIPPSPPPPSLSPPRPLPTLPPSPPHPLSPILPSPPFPPSNKFIVLSSLSKALVFITLQHSVFFHQFLNILLWFKYHDAYPTIISQWYCIVQPASALRSIQALVLIDQRYIDMIIVSYLFVNSTITSPWPLSTTLHVGV